MNGIWIFETMHYGNQKERIAAGIKQLSAKVAALELSQQVTD